MNNIFAIDQESTNKANRAYAKYNAKIKNESKLSVMLGSNIGLEDQKAVVYPNKTAGTKFNITNSQFNVYLAYGFNYPKFMYDPYKSNFVMILSKFKPHDHVKMSAKQKGNTGGVDITFKQKHKTMTDAFGWNDGYTVFLHLRNTANVNLKDDMQIEFDMLEQDSQALNVNGYRMAFNIPNVDRNIKYRLEAFKTNISASAYERYRKEVDMLTDQSIKIDVDLIKDSNLRNNPGMSVDHIFSVHDGFKYNLPTELIAHHVNLQYLPLAGYNGNCSKNKNSWQSIQDLIIAYKNATGMVPLGINNIKFGDYFEDA